MCLRLSGYLWGARYGLDNNIDGRSGAQRFGVLVWWFWDGSCIYVNGYALSLMVDLEI